VDQQLEERFGTHPALAVEPARRKKMRRVGGFLVAPDRYYHPNHVWVRRLNGKVRLGIDDFVCRLLGEISDIHVVSRDDASQGDVAWELQCHDHTISIALPLSGRVVQVNQDVLDDPPLVCKDPYGRGWIMMLASTNFEQDRGTLIELPQALQWLQSEAERLRTRCETWVGREAGGEQDTLPDDFSRLIPKHDWQEIVAEFLQPSPEPLVAVEAEGEEEAEAPPAPRVQGRKGQWFDRLLHPFSD